MIKMGLRNNEIKAWEEYMGRIEWAQGTSELSDVNHNHNSQVLLS